MSSLLDLLNRRIERLFWIFEKSNVERRKAFELAAKTPVAKQDSSAP